MSITTRGIYLILGLVLFAAKAQSQNLDCSSGNSDGGVYSFTINASAPGMGNINLMYVQHDSVRKIPLSTTVLHNELNMLRTYERKDDFRRHNCSAIFPHQTTCQNTFKMTPEQQAASGRTAFDRGHVTPANPYRFSEDALSSTFLCVNIAPQDPYTNQGPWVAVEASANEYFAEKAGYVMTGICDLDNMWSPTIDGWRVPNCFWKLICYVDSQGDTQVVGFLGNNTLLHSSDTAGKAQRTAETILPRGQSEILNVMSRTHFIMEAWSGARAFLHRNRADIRAPSAAQCQSKRTISAAVRSEWSNLLDEIIHRAEFVELI